MRIVYDMRTYYILPCVIFSLVCTGNLAAWKFFPETILGPGEIAFLFVGFVVSVLVLRKAENFARRTYGVVLTISLALHLSLISMGFTKRLPALNGDVFEEKTTLVLLVWGIVASLLFFFPKIFRSAAVFCLVFSLAGVGFEFLGNKSQVGYFSYGSDSVQPVFSKNKKNVIMIIVDTARADVFDEALLGVGLEGVTIYEKYLSNFTSTFTSVPYILSGVNPLGEKYAEYQKKFECKVLQSELISNGWRVYNFPYEFLKETLPLKSCNTSAIEKGRVSSVGILRKIWMSVNAALYYGNVGNLFGESGALRSSIAERPKSDEIKLRELLNAKFENTEQPVFAFYHFNGLHAPLPKISEESSRFEDYRAFSGVWADRIKQIVDSFRNKGGADDTVFYVMGDHGTEFFGRDYRDIEVRNRAGQDNEIVQFATNSKEGRFLKEVTGGQTDSRHVPYYLYATGIAPDDYLTARTSMNFGHVSRGDSVMQLSRAALVKIELNMRGTKRIGEVVFSSLVRSEILATAGLQSLEGNVSVLHDTPFTGNITSEAMTARDTCNVVENSIACRESISAVDTPEGSKARLKDDVFRDLKFGNVAFFDVAIEDAKKCGIVGEGGSRLYPIDKVECVRKEGRAGIDVFPSSRYGDLEISNVSVDRGGDISLIGKTVQIFPREKNDGTAISLVSEGGKRIGKYTIQACSGRYELALPTGVLFDIYDTRSDGCAGLSITNSEPLIPAVIDASTKDSRVINARINLKHSGGFLNSTWVGGVLYPVEKGGLRWVSTFPFYIFRSICGAGVKAHFFPSKTGDVSMIGLDKSASRPAGYARTINDDQLVDLDSDLCLSGDWDVVRVDAKRQSHFVIDTDPRTYAAQLFEKAEK